MSKKHLTNDQRYTISVMYQRGHKQKDIAATIDKNKSVVSREIKRNTNPINRQVSSSLRSGYGKNS